GSFIPQAFTDYFRTPSELGWLRSEGPLPEHPFLGREAVLAQREAGGRTLVGLVWNPEDVIDVLAAPLRSEPIPDLMELPRRLGPEFDQVLVDNAIVGVSSGRALSTNLRAMISLCVIDPEYAQPGTDVVVLWGRPGTSQCSIRATVTQLPFKPDRRRTAV
ncbi:MAG: aminomethyl transferase family protein, partial [Thermoleophilia bacterium]|nr:hypothetical protein [Gaiellaceae bacterium]MDW8339831.1 aminomethyl transferase family protein [Thermoleophilia bacterium]